MQKQQRKEYFELMYTEKKINQLVMTPTVTHLNSPERLIVAI